MAARDDDEGDVDSGVGGDNNEAPQQAATDAC